MTGSQHNRLLLSDSRHNGDCHLTQSAKPWGFEWQVSQVLWVLKPYAFYWVSDADVNILLTNGSLQEQQII